MTPEPALALEPSRGWGPARQTLRALLARQGRTGLSGPALEALVGRVHFTCWRAEQTVVGPEDRSDFLRIVVGGVVKIVCQGVRAKPVTVQLVGPGGFLRLVPPSGDTVRAVWAVAHTSALIGLLPDAAWHDVACNLRGDECVRLAACAWQSLSGRLYEKCTLLALPIRGRVLHELRVLARDFGRPHPAGVCIDLPLSHADLAELVGAARANVTRAVGALRAAGILASTPGRLVLTAGA